MAERDVEPSIQVLARHITTRPPAADINEARSTLKQSITTNESSLHGIAVSNTPVITHQLDEKAKLNQRSNSAQRGVKALADDFDVSSLDRVTEVETFRTTASTLQSSHQAQTLARTTATAVENLKQRYDLLVRLEDGVWSGMSADPSIVAALLELDGQRQENAGAAVQMALALLAPRRTPNLRPMHRATHSSKSPTLWTLSELFLAFFKTFMLASFVALSAAWFPISSPFSIPPPAENSSPPVQSVVPTGRRTSNPEIPVLSETFRISMAANTVIGLAASTLDELINVLSLQPAVHSFSSVSRGLSEQLAEALDLIRASIPVAQSTSIERNPIHLIQLSNDYRYLSSKLETIKTDVEWVDRTDCARRFSTASVITLETFVAGQSAVLSGLLDHAKGFADTTNPSSFMQVEHAVLQVVTFFKNIATQLATYVDGEVYHTVLGKLVESSVTGILSSVLALEDITELESLRIGSLLSSVEALGNLFQRDHANVSTVAAFVPNWIKFGYLNELLRAKLVEITYLYDNGSLVDFNSKELGGLVRALFADSPQRATLLDKIEM
ncbi:hypothetical protein CcaverHIS002_0604250 [Cutaneotrichosporon cavernicola]|nr:hypothetical protein CcaverHIS002_0604250 [Cutaneotrichosporon cavernicola]